MIRKLGEKIELLINDNANNARKLNGVPAMPGTTAPTIPTKANRIANTIRTYIIVFRLLSLSKYPFSLRR
jgi:hypothetical protein